MVSAWAGRDGKPDAGGSECEERKGQRCGEKERGGKLMAIERRYVVVAASWLPCTVSVLVN